ncbi:hypothetical protein BCR34DRAFT_285176 [Clohesyomyces aquaticus]|uniref:Ankyrin repeat-containing domain protein n=1 Tax=Clohesyomyces aquaticus TaxID=1231657 RepID=A0A1Y1ZSN0_9PLEO|nr:hypothetical protein BCR34DRAFT_285176 [Clohesyomyces aquaticus]
MAKSHRVERYILPGAVMHGRVDVVLWLADRAISCADFTRYPDTKFAFLRSAAQQGHFQVAKLLLEKMGACREIERRRIAPEHVVTGGSVEIAELLRQEGMSFENDLGLRQWVFAVEFGHLDMAKYLKPSGMSASLGFWPEAALLKAIVQDRREMVRWLISDCGVDPCGHISSSDVPLLPLVLAVDSGSVEMVRLVKDLGGKADSQALHKSNFHDGKRRERSRVLYYEHIKHLKSWIDCNSIRGVGRLVCRNWPGRVDHPFSEEALEAAQDSIELGDTDNDSAIE